MAKKSKKQSSPTQHHVSKKPPQLQRPAEKLPGVAKSLVELRDKVTESRKSFSVFHKEVVEVHKLREEVRELHKADKELKSFIDTLQTDVSKLPTMQDLDVLESGVKDRIIAESSKIHHQLGELNKKLEKLDHRLTTSEDTIMKIFDTLIAQTENWFTLGKSVLTGETEGKKEEKEMAAEDRPLV
jgi:seryl-tRNA synthetase